MRVSMFETRLQFSVCEHIYGLHILYAQWSRTIAARSSPSYAYVWTHAAYEERGVFIHNSTSIHSGGLLEVLIKYVIRQNGSQAQEHTHICMCIPYIHTPRKYNRSKNIIKETMVILTDFRICPVKSSNKSSRKLTKITCI